MAQINPKLLERLENKLKIGRRRLNERITEVANRERVERITAALMIAADEGLPIDRFSTPEERATMRIVGFSKMFPRPSAPLPIPQFSDARSNPKAVKTKRKPKTVDANSVFVVHGRDENLRRSMFDFLHSIGLKPLEWEKALLLARGANPHIGEILDAAMGRVQAVVVLFSPDDDAMLNASLHGKKEPATERRLQGQPRPNVLFEAGLAMGRHAEKTLIVQVGTVRGFSDIAGRHIVRLSNDQGKRNDVINRLEKIGCKVDRRGNDWMTKGDFVPQRNKVNTR
jgi:predicted nucleotide-binding protein